MPVFHYKAIDEAQVAKEGVIASDSARQAREELRKLGLQVLKINLASQAASIQMPGFFKRSWNHWVANFTGELATLVSVGVPLLEALDTLSLQYKGKAKAIVLRLNDDVSSGVSLSEAMSRQPEVFDELCVKLLEVGQNTGNMDEILRQLSDFKRRSHEFKDRVLSALLYPAIILSVSIGVSIFLMTFVVPMLLDSLIETGKPLPLPTRILHSASIVLGEHGWWMALALCAAVVGMIGALRTDRGKRKRDQILAEIPLIGMMSKKQEIARVSLVLATLMKSGVEFIDAIRITIGTSKNVLMREALEACAKEVESGKDIGAALSQSSWLPPMVSQVFSVGQNSGRLEEMLFRLSKDYDQQVESIASRLSTVIEPALILLLSVFIGFIMFATLMPMMEAGNVL